MNESGNQALNPKMEEAARSIEKSLPLLLAYQFTAAKIQRARYLALMEEGFNEAQALELCRGVGG